MKEDNIKVLIAFILGVIISGIGVYVATKKTNDNNPNTEKMEKKNALEATIGLLKENIYKKYLIIIVNIQCKKVVQTEV